MNNRTTIMIALLAVVMMMGPASADTDVIIANGTHNLTIGFNTMNDSVVNASNWTWCINITNPTVGDWQWVNISVWNGTDWQSVNGNNTTFLANASNKANTTGWTYCISNETNYTAVISLNTTNSTVHLDGFDVNISNSGNLSEWAKLSELNFTAGPVTAAQSSIVNETSSAVANNTDKMLMTLALRDVYDNPILTSTVATPTATNVNVTGATGTVFESSFPINQTTGNVTFNITATKAGAYNVSAVCDEVMINSTTTVFTAGPAYKLVFYGPNSATGSGTKTINQTVAIQDVNSNNVTWDTLNGTPYQLIASTPTDPAPSSASVVSGNPICVNEANATNVSFMGTNYTSTFELINFSFQNTANEAITIRVSGNGSLQSTSEKTLTYYGLVHYLSVHAGESSMYANGGNDSILVTVQLKDDGGNDIKSAGVSIQLSGNDSLFNGLESSDTDADGKATFNVTSTTKSGSGVIDAITASDPSGKTGASQSITLKQAPNPGNCDVVNTTSSIKAGNVSTITATIKDYDNKVISGWAVTFNITSGAGTFVDKPSPCTVSAVTNGNASVSVTSINVSTTITVNVTIANESSVPHQIGGYEQTFEVDPAEITKLVIDPASAGLENENGTVATFNVTTTDDYDNLNDTVLNLNVSNSNEVLGNLSTHGLADYTNNNLSLTTSGGYVKFNFTINSTVTGSTTLNVTANTIYNAGNIATNLSKTAIVTTSGPSDVIVSFNTTTPVVGDLVEVYAQLTDGAGNPLDIADKDLTFTVMKEGGSVPTDVRVNATNATGVALYDMSVSELGTYTVTASNATLDLSNASSITFVGLMVSIVATANDTEGTYSTPVNSTVTINATAKDSGGNDATGTTGTVTFLVRGSSIGSASFTNGVASITYTKSVAGSHTILAYRNATLHDEVTVVFTTGELANMTVTAMPSSVAVNTSTPVVFNVTSDGTPVVGATVTLIGAFSNVSTTGADGTVTIDVNATSVGTINVTATMTGYADAETTVTVSAAVEYDPADTNQDCVVDGPELMAHIGKWKTGEVEGPELMTSIGRWKLGSGGYC